MQKDKISPEIAGVLREVCSDMPQMGSIIDRIKRYGAANPTPSLVLAEGTKIRFIYDHAHKGK
jgi:hypothetical protein